MRPIQAAKILLKILAYMIELVYYYTMNARLIDNKPTNWTNFRLNLDNIRSKFEGNIARIIS
jgi:hypothetical protein